MIRKIITIDKERCNGCGQCVSACHEGAIGMENGKAALLRDDYCDGLGNCLPVCPTGAITVEEREADAYKEAAYAADRNFAPSLPCGCPSTQAKTIVHTETYDRALPSTPTVSVGSQLNQWPVQIKLVPVNAAYWKDAHLLIAADCTAYAYANFHRDMMKNRITLIGCPKLDEGDYTEKLTAILRQNTVRSVRVVRMEVPCCGGLEQAVKTARAACGKWIPWQVTVVSTDGQILNDSDGGEKAER